MPAGLRCASTRERRPCTSFPRIVKRLKGGAAWYRPMGFMNGAVPKPGREPLWIHPADDGLLLFAGLYEAWQPRPGEWQTTFTILTTAANRLLEPIHNRMPVILDEAGAADWMNLRGPDPVSLRRLLVPAPDALLLVRPASPLVNSVKNEGPELLEDLSLFGQ